MPAKRGSRVPRISSQEIPLRVKQFTEQPGCRAVHWVAQESELCVAQARPIDQFFDGVQIGVLAVSSGWINSLRGGSDGAPSLCTLASSLSICATMDGKALLP